MYLAECYQPLPSKSSLSISGISWFSKLICSGKLFKKRFVWKPNHLCHLKKNCRHHYVTHHKGSAWKGCWMENQELKFSLTTETLFPWTTWSRTELFKNRDIWDLRFDCIFSHSCNTGMSLCCIPFQSFIYIMYKFYIFSILAQLVLTVYRKMRWCKERTRFLQFLIKSCGKPKLRWSYHILA